MIKLKTKFKKVALAIFAGLLTIIAVFSITACNSANCPTCPPLPQTLEEVFAKNAPSVVSVQAGSQIGTGFLYRIENGASGNTCLFFVTNHHVVVDYINNPELTQNAIMLQFYLDNANSILGGKNVELLGYDILFDIAVLRVSGNVDIGSRVELSDIATHTNTAAQLLAIGNMGGYGIAAFGGLLSNPNRILDFGLEDSTPGTRFRKKVQVCVNLNAGTSGAPILDMHGRLVAIATAQKPFDDYGRPQVGISFATAAAVAAPLINRAIMLQHGTAIPRLSAEIENGDTIWLANLGGMRLQIDNLNRLVVVESGASVVGSTGTLPQTGDIITMLGEVDTIAATYTKLFSALNSFAHRNNYISANVPSGSLTGLNITFTRNTQTHTFSVPNFVMVILC